MLVLVVMNRANGALIEQFYHDLADGFRLGGAETELVLFDQDGDWQWYEGLCRRIDAMVEDGRPFFVVDCNAKLKYSHCRHKSFPRFSFVTDAPWSQHENIFGYDGALTVNYVDQRHVHYLADMGCPHPAVFLPHGGPAPAAGRLPMEQRDLPAVFVGNLTAVPDLAGFRHRLAGAPAVLAGLCEQALPQVLDGGDDPYLALRDRCRAQGMDCARDLAATVVAQLVGHIAAYAEAYHRLAALKALSRVPILWAGDVAPSVRASGLDHVQFIGPVSAEHALALMARARVVLNSVAVFRAGSHERIWYGMAGGAVVATDLSSYVAEDFTYGRHLLDIGAAGSDHGQGMRDLIETPTALQDMVDAALPIYARRHTWAQRADVIHSCMER